MVTICGCHRTGHVLKVKVKAFSYLIRTVGPGADPGVQAVSLQVTVSHPPGGRLPLLSTRPAVTSPAAEHHRPLAGTKLYRLVTDAHRCKQLAQGCYAELPRVGFEPATYWSQVQHCTRCTTAPPTCVTDLVFYHLWAPGLGKGYEHCVCSTRIMRLFMPSMQITDHCILLSSLAVRFPLSYLFQSGTLTTKVFCSACLP